MTNGTEEWEGTNRIRSRERRGSPYGDAETSEAGQGRASAAANAEVEGMAGGAREMRKWEGGNRRKTP